MNLIYFSKRTIFIVYFLIICLALGACRKFVQIPPAPNLIVTSQVFSDSTDADAAVLALYITMIRSATVLAPFDGGITVYTGLSSDELYSTRGLAPENSIYANAILQTNTTISSLWSSSYQLAYKANAIIEGLTGSKAMEASARDQLIGEAKIVRALVYFNLVNLYGAVPFVTSTNYEMNAVIPRTPVDSVYKGIISDLVSAQSLLSDNYLTAGRVRPNSYTASALLSRVYLYRKDWRNAENMASRIINDSGTYKIVNDLNKVFLSSIANTNNTEAIWQLTPVQPGYETTEGYFFIPTSSTVKPKYVISDFLLTAFETDDLRKTAWMKGNTIGGKIYKYPFKYKLGKDGNATEFYMIFRLAEQYLIRAEALAQQGKLEDAAVDLNMIRNRAGLLPNSASTQEDLLSAIYHERQVELFCEWGHRWFDLKRTEQVNTIMPEVTSSKAGSWDTNWQLYPIYLDELNQNHFLTQNPGYH